MSKNNDSLTVDHFLRCFPVCPVCHSSLEFSGYAFHCPFTACNQFYAILNPKNKKLIDELQLFPPPDQENKTNYYGYFYDSPQLHITDSENLPPDPWSKTGFPCSFTNLIQLFQSPSKLSKFLIFS